MLREVAVTDLAPGMYIAELDRPWLETPFPLQGFYIRTDDDRNSVARFCEFVMVDPRRYDAGLANASSCRLDSAMGGTAKRGARRHARAGFGRAHSTAYEDIRSFEIELPEAREALNESFERFETAWQALLGHSSLKANELRDAVKPLVQSVLRNKDALIALLRVQRVDQHTHQHCLAMAVWAALLGRQMGFPAGQIETLAYGCSLCDVGKARLPSAVLHKEAALTDEEFALVRAHVEHSLQLLEEAQVHDRPVLEIVRWHHERMDGSGYPDRLQRDQIPVFARIAGIVDSYDAMISPRIHVEARSSYQALVELQDRSPQLYNTELVDQFAQAIGLFPNGCLVELSSGEVGIVCAQNTGRRLRPKVMLVMHADKRRRTEFDIIDLTRYGEHDLSIARELRTGEHGIDAKEFFL